MFKGTNFGQEPANLQFSNLVVFIFHFSVVKFSVFFFYLCSALLNCLVTACVLWLSSHTLAIASHIQVCFSLPLPAAAVEYIPPLLNLSPPCHSSLQ